MWKSIVDSVVAMLSSFLAGLKFVCTFTVGTKDEVDKTVTKVKEISASKDAE